MSQSLIIQQPDAPAERLMLLFHGVGGSPAEMAPLGRRLAESFRDAFIVSVAAYRQSDRGPGRQWFSIREISDENRPIRVATAMPHFRAGIGYWQRQANVTADGTMLFGFSQGAIMSLESIRIAREAAYVVAMAGRFASAPTVPPGDTSFHLLHGESDSVIASTHSVNAGNVLRGWGADVTVDLLPSVGHVLHEEMQHRAIARLGRYLEARSASRMLAK
jgi:phospholipase/carboxylesterase